jgi:GNAT superfamily N-acetyltransferase
MLDWVLVESLPSTEDLNRLRHLAGWHVRNEKATERGLAGSLFGVCAVAGGEVVGAARVVGDGACVFYVQDVLVAPTHRRHGIAQAMMESVMGYIARTACEGAVVGLMAAHGVETLYERFGFKRRPTESLGHGMSFWFHREGS